MTYTQLFIILANVWLATLSLPWWLHILCVIVNIGAAIHAGLSEKSE